MKIIAVVSLIFLLIVSLLSPLPTEASGQRRTGAWASGILDTNEIHKTQCRENLSGGFNCTTEIIPAQPSVLDTMILQRQEADMEIENTRYNNQLGTEAAIQLEIGKELIRRGIDPRTGKCIPGIECSKK